MGAGTGLSGFKLPGSRSPVLGTLTRIGQDHLFAARKRGWAIRALPLFEWVAKKDEMQISKISKAQMLEYQRRYGNDGHISKVLGVTRQAVFQRRKTLGIPSMRSMNPRRDEKIKALFCKGMSVRDLVCRFGMSFSQVYRIVKNT